MKHGARGKRQTLKSASTDLGTTDVGKKPTQTPDRVLLLIYSQCDVKTDPIYHKNISGDDSLKCSESDYSYFFYVLHDYKLLTQWQ